MRANNARARINGKKTHAQFFFFPPPHAMTLFFLCVCTRKQQTNGVFVPCATPCEDSSLVNPRDVVHSHEQVVVVVVHLLLAHRDSERREEREPRRDAARKTTTTTTTTNASPSRKEGRRTRTRERLRRRRFAESCCSLFCFSVRLRFLRKTFYF
jgi:hypothetical protein